MKDLNVSEFKARLSRYLREVKAGETLVITEYKQPVAEVRRFGGRESIEVPSSRPFSLEDSRPSRPSPGLAADLVAEDRSER